MFKSNILGYEVEDITFTRDLSSMRGINPRKEVMLESQNPKTIKILKQWKDQKFGLNAIGKSTSYMIDKLELLDQNSDKSYILYNASPKTASMDGLYSLVVSYEFILEKKDQ